MTILGTTTTIRVSQILETIDHLKPMPANVTRILHEIENPNTPIPVIAGMIGQDQVLAALVLQAANTAALGYVNACFSIHEAVMRIGFRRLKSLLFLSTSYQSMNGALHGYRLGIGELWLHSQRTASACENLARLLHSKHVEEAYVSGLLHDIGKLILNEVMQADYSRIATFIIRYKMSLWEIEKKLIGIDHAQAGCLMAEHWNLPANLADSIHFHHYPALAPANSYLPAIVNLANSIVGLAPGVSDGLSTYDLAPETLEILGLKPDSIDEISAAILQPPQRNA
jgi:putative nucleotidyltransferase with HDIG domain